MDPFEQRGYLEKLWNAAEEADADYAECDLWRYDNRSGKKIYRSCYGRMGQAYTLPEHMKYGPTATYKAISRKSLWEKYKLAMPKCSFESPALDLLRSSGIPFVLLSRYLDGAQDDCVICDDEQGGYLAASHLIENGHRNLAMISFRHVIFSSRKRFEGFQRACLEAGLPEQNIHYAEPENPEEILRQLKSWQEEGVTGLFSFCDVEAWQTITKTIVGATASTKIQFSSPSTGTYHRWFLDDICIK